MRQRFARWMQGRYGSDQLTVFLIAAALVLMVLELFIPVPRMRHGMNTLGLLMLAVAYLRMFSRNFAGRREENERFLWHTRRLRGWWDRRRAGGKTHRIFRCPSCRQAIRIPRGKGRVAITCPKCHREFIRRT